MKTVPLHGKIAAGRVALVDDTDYAFVMLYRWHAYELLRPGRRPQGPYAATNYTNGDGRRTTIQMHVLIMGARGVDHRNHDGLDNRRSNLRVATKAQNTQNARGKLGSVSQYKGVSWHRKANRWVAAINRGGHRYSIGHFDSEIEAAYAYDAAARDAYGEFAYTNFASEPTRAMREEWAVLTAWCSAERKRKQYESVRQWWADREFQDHVCEICGAPYRSKATRNRYCSRKCRYEAYEQRRAQRREQEAATALSGLLF